MVTLSVNVQGLVVGLTVRSALAGYKIERDIKEISSGLVDINRYTKTVGFEHLDNILSC